MFSHPENADKKYKALFDGIDSGKIKLSMFQRDFVRDKEQSAKLIPHHIVVRDLQGHLHLQRRKMSIIAISLLTIKNQIRSQTSH